MNAIRFLRRSAAALAVLTWSGLGLAAGAVVEEIPYFHRVNERVAVSGQPTPEQIPALAQAGFLTIINLRPEAEFPASAEEKAAADAGLHYVAIPFATAKPSDIAVEEFLRVTANADVYPVLVHCATANRASALWLIRRVLHDGWSLADAEKEAKENGLTNDALLRFAREYVEAHPAPAVPPR